MMLVALVSALVLDFDGQCATWVPFLVSGHECSFAQYLSSDAPTFVIGWLQRYWIAVLLLLAVVSVFPLRQTRSAARDA